MHGKALASSYKRNNLIVCEEMNERRFDRITMDPEIMGGKPTIRDTRVTIGAILYLLSAGYAETKILDEYPYLESQDIQQALEFAAWRISE